MTRSRPRTLARPNARRGLRAGLFLGLVLLLSGCLKYELTLMVNEDDTLDGTLIVAVAREFAIGEDIFGQTGELTSSEGTITKEPYEDADYIGSRYVISGVPISEIDELSTDSSTSFALTHEGDEFQLEATINFNVGGTEAVPTDASFTAMASFTFPGAVLESNGTIDGNTVTWTELRPDVDNTLSARASAIANGRAGDPTATGIPWWAWALGGAGVLLAAALIVLVIARRRRSARTAATDAAAPVWPQQQGAYNEYGIWVPAAVYGQDSGYYDSGQEGGYGSYYGTYGDTASQSRRDTDTGSQGDTYRGPPGAERHPETGFPQGGYSGSSYPQGTQGQSSGGYSGQTVVGYPGASEPPSPWAPRPPG